MTGSFYMFAKPNLKNLKNKTKMRQPNRRDSDTVMYTQCISQLQILEEIFLLINSGKYPKVVSD